LPATLHAILPGSFIKDPRLLAEIENLCILDGWRQSPPSVPFVAPVANAGF
jgi:hypothetical protein